MNKTLIHILIVSAVLISCKNKEHTKEIVPAIDSSLIKKEQRPEPEAPPISYRLISKKEWKQKKDSMSEINFEIVEAINRVDSLHLLQLDSIILPRDISKPLYRYLPFPQQVDYLKDVHKILLFSYPAQVFAAYENGKLIRTGPTSMGRKNKPTPQRLYFTNWKAKRTVSTIDDAWILNWNFNVQNQWGVGFHEYDLPGYPASHSCMRLLKSDAEFLYNWADQWVLKDNQLAASGTPVLVFGKYHFGQPKPWLQLVQDPSILNISADSLQKIITPHLDIILAKQKQRQDVIWGLK